MSVNKPIYGPPTALSVKYSSGACKTVRFSNRAEAVREWFRMMREEKIREMRVVS